MEELKAQQSELTALSSNSKHIIAEQSGHFIQLVQPDLVMSAIQEIVGAILEEPSRTNQNEPAHFIGEYLSIWTGIFLKRDRWKMSKETVNRLPVH